MSFRKPFNLTDFTVKKLLKNNDKKLVVLCKSAKSQKFSILELVKTADLKITYGQICTLINKLAIDVTKNDVYYIGNVTLESKTIACRFTCPAKETLIRSYDDEVEVSDCWEWPRDFRNHTQKQLADAPSSKFIQGLCDGSADQEYVLFRDDNQKTGFALVRDMFWDERDVKELSCTAFVARKDLRCVRDLTANEIPLLENVLHKSKKAISARYKLPVDQIHAMIEYHPRQFWHLHIEFLYKKDISNTWYELNHVISCLRFNTEFYVTGKLAVKCRSKEVTKKLEPISKKDLESFQKAFETGKKRVLGDQNK